MQFTTALFALFATMAAAQDTSLIPACARPCFRDSLGLSGCAGETDFRCLCASSAYNTAVLTCVTTSSGCSATDQLATLSWAQNTCNSVGVPIQI